jgi:hypothetical protein
MCRDDLHKSYINELALQTGLPNPNLKKTGDSLIEIMK